MSYDNRYADLLFEVVSGRYEKRSTLISTNRVFQEWGEVFPNAACVVTLVDRLTHCAEIINIKGESYRLKEAKERNRAQGPGTQAAVRRWWPAAVASALFTGTARSYAAANTRSNARESGEGGPRTAACRARGTGRRRAATPRARRPHPGGSLR